ncbi:MAG: hypothetical protein K2P58_15880 [Hyphomonadaceae bacterium]|nr:hypothetical protein [Hyphomonadaceae bacterium]
MGRVDIDAELNGLEARVWARIDARARHRTGAAANGAVAGVCALVLMVSSAIGVSTATASATVEAGPFALDQPYAPATALGR